ncbi:MAG: hypothetical protein HC794_06290 [Nitrospiraceae bacterium]|nr:hypothetical protein [Nitrospiraceae bacterium]
MSEAEGRAIKLLTPKKEERNHETDERRETKRELITGAGNCSNAEEIMRFAEEMNRQLQAHPGRRLRIEWSLQE